MIPACSLRGSGMTRDGSGRGWLGRYRISDNDVIYNISIQLARVVMCPVSRIDMRRMCGL